MAQTKQNTTDEGSVDVHEDAGVGSAQVKPTDDRSKAEIKADLTNPADADLGVLSEPKHEADQTSVPTQYAPIDRPPVSTSRPDEPIVQSLVTGAGKHEPPDPDKYDEMGRPRDTV